METQRESLRAPLLADYVETHVCKLLRLLCFLFDVLFRFCVFVLCVLARQAQRFCRPRCLNAIREGGLLGREGRLCLGSAGEGLDWATRTFDG